MVVARRIQISALNVYIVGNNMTFSANLTKASPVGFLFIVLLICLCSVAQGQRKPPRFSDYPVTERFTGKPAPVNFKDRNARALRTVLREGAKGGPNFAGHYTVVSWGCGMGTFTLAVVDARTGRVYFPPFDCVSGNLHGLPEGLDKGDNPAFRIDSKLLIIKGSRDEEGGGLYYYTFENNRFRLVHSIEDKSLLEPE